MWTLDLTLDLGSEALKYVNTMHAHTGSKKTKHVNACHVKTKENKKNVAFSMFSITFDRMAFV